MRITTTTVAQPAQGFIAAAARVVGSSSFMLEVR
jgi:hypothetical protein